LVFVGEKLRKLKIGHVIMD